MMFWDKIKLLITMLIVFLMIGVSANVIALNHDTDTNINTNKDLVNINDNIISDSEQESEETIITKNIPLEKVDPNEIINSYPQLGNPMEAYPSKYLEGQDIEDITIPAEIGVENPVLSPDQILRLSANLNSQPEKYPIDGSRGSRADAGNNEGSAEIMKDGFTWMNDTADCRVDPNPNPHYVVEDNDWFRIPVIEKGNIEVDYVTIRIECTVSPGSTYNRNLYCLMFEPLSVVLNTTGTWPFSGPNQGDALSTADGEVQQYFSDLEILGAGENGTLNAAPAINSNFFILIYALSDVDVPYNITMVTKTQISPEDKNNYPENSTVLQTASKNNQNLEQHKDHWDWFDISDFFDYTGDVWENKISYTVDITSEERGPSNDHSWVTVFVLYDSEEGNTLFINGDERNTGGSPSRTGTDPIQHSFTTAGSKAWIGIRVRSMRYDSGDYLFMTWDGKVTYDLSFSISVQNFAPQLYQAKREPDDEWYFLEDEITFKIRYRDIDDNFPTYMHVTVDGIDYDMTTTGSDYISGVVYSKTFFGSDLGITPYPHTFNFSASDGLEPIVLALSPPKNEFKIIQNQTPLVYSSAPNQLSLKEDDNDVIISSDQIFEDVDLTDGMDFYIKKGDSYGKKFESPRMEVFINDNTKLKIQLTENQHGSDIIWVRAREVLKRNLDTYEFFAFHKINITVSAENDQPLLDPIANIQGHEGFEIKIPISATDPDILTDNDELTFSTNRSDGDGPDDLPGFELTVDKEDKTKANISFTPGNEHVGKFLVEVAVKDKEGAEDTLDVEFEVLNTNDPPIITQIETDKTTEIIQPDDTEIEFTSKKYGATEDEWFNMTLTIVDQDISIGVKNEIEFRVVNSSFNTPVNIEYDETKPLKAVVGVLPSNSEVGTNYINLSVHDGKGGEDEIAIIIKTYNVNDPPEIPEILKPEGENATFSIVDEIKFEGQGDDRDFDIPNSDEELTYIWYLIHLDGSNKIEELFQGKITKKEKFDFKIQPKARFLIEGQYKIKLILRDSEKAESLKEITITISEDYDGDNILDVWEDKYGLNPHNRKDAMEDLDTDGYSNLEEFESDTNPYDKTDSPAKKSADVDYTYALIGIIVVIVIIILLIVVMRIRSRKKEKKDLEDLDSLAYPAEQNLEMELAQPMGPGSMPPGPGMPGMPPGPGMPGMPPGPGMPGMPPGIPPGFPPMMPMQMPPQQVGDKIPQKQAQTQAQTQVPVQQGQQTQSISSGKDASVDPKTQLGSVNLAPQLPPGSKNGKEESSAPEGRQSPIDSVSSDELGEPDLTMKDENKPDLELVPGEPGYLSQSEVEGEGITSSEDDGSAEESEMKCPNCGIAVKSGWFLCPGCKSPLN
jgi:hypothetical protein